MAYAAGFLDELRSRISLAEIVGRHVRLQKRGREYTGLCPFHKEKTPSFNVVEEKGFYHCFAGETGVITRDGVVPIGELSGKTATILTRGGRWQSADIRCYGRQRLYRIELSRNGIGKILHATSGHRWFVRGRIGAVITTALKPGHRLESVWPAKRPRWAMDAAGVRHGIVFGDGTVQRKGSAGYGTVNLHGDKAGDLAGWFADYECYRRVYGGRDFEHMKCLPSASADDDYVLGFIAGYLATDGHVAKDGTVMLHSTDGRVLDWIRAAAGRLGIGTFGITSQTRQGYLPEQTPISRIHFVNSSLDSEFFLRKEARARFTASSKQFERLRWVVRSVTESDRIEDVFCAEVEGEHAFSLEDNILTGNCFGCGAHGDVIGFAMRMSNLSFREAVEDLARQAGVQIPADDPRETARAARAATLYEVCEAAGEFFTAQLHQPRGGPALAYLKNRGVTEALMAEFRLGYAPSSGNPLANQLAAKFPQELLLEAGLIRRDEAGRIYDFFRDRVMFPIMNRRGQIIAFGGRVMGEGNPKYLNSPDSPIFQKGRNLFALNLARRSVTAETPPIVAEGYMDVIALHGGGFKTAVAPLGTALTEKQIGDLWRLAPEPILCFDGDAPGQKAALRALDRALPLLQPGFALRFVTLPEGEDPDSLIQKSGAAEFKRALAGAQQLSEFLWSSVTKGRDFSTPERFSRLEVAVKEKVARIENGQSQRQYNRYFSDRLWDLYLRTRKDRSRKPKEATAHLNNFSGHRAADQVMLLLLALAIRNPELIRDDIDQFAAMTPRTKAHVELQHKVIDTIAENPETTAEELEDALQHSGLGAELHRIFRSKMFLSGIAQSKTLYFAKAPIESVGSTWRALFQRLWLPETQKNLDDAVANFAAESTEDNWATIILHRQLLEDLSMEVELIKERWDAAERTEPWSPRAAA